MAFWDIIKESCTHTILSLTLSRKIWGTYASQFGHFTGKLKDDSFHLKSIKLHLLHIIPIDHFF